MKLGKLITPFDIAKTLDVEEEYYLQILSDLGPDRDLLKRAGWTIQNTNPLTISNEEGSLAVGQAAIHAIHSIISSWKDLETIDQVIHSRLKQ